MAEVVLWFHDGHTIYLFLLNTSAEGAGRTNHIKKAMAIQELCTLSNWYNYGVLEQWKAKGIRAHDSLVNMLIPVAESRAPEREC